MCLAFCAEKNIHGYIPYSFQCAGCILGILLCLILAIYDFLPPLGAVIQVVVCLLVHSVIQDWFAQLQSPKNVCGLCL